MVLDFMTNLDYNVQADNLKCKQPEQNVEKSRSLVERARLEIVYTPQGYRGFESLLLRHIFKSEVVIPLIFFKKTKKTCVHSSIG